MCVTNCQEFHTARSSFKAQYCFSTAQEATERQQDWEVRIPRTRFKGMGGKAADGGAQGNAAWGLTALIKESCETLERKGIALSTSPPCPDENTLAGQQLYRTHRRGAPPLGGTQRAARACAVPRVWERGAHAQRRP